MATKSDSRSESPTAQELLRAATELTPTLKARADQTEQLRQVTPESVAEMFASGLLRVAVPLRFGGADLDYGLALDIAAELARSCPSTGWCYGLWAAHAWLVGYFPLEAQEEVFDPGPDVLCSSSLNAGKSECVAVEGGYRVTGRWQFSSGCDHASWMMLGVSGIGDRSWVLVPRGDCEIVDTWFVSGLRGSGSKDIVLEDAFVPHHRVLNVATAGDSDHSGWRIHRQPRYRVPVPVLLGWDLVAPMLGIAQGMIDEFTSSLAHTSGPGRTAGNPH